MRDPPNEGRSTRGAAATLVLGSLAFLLPGIAFLVRPGLLRFVGVDPIGADGATEIRALYGGLEVAIAVALFVCALRHDLRRSGLTLQAILFGGLVGGRLSGVAASGGASALNLALAGLESSGLAVTVWIRSRLKRART